MKICKVHLSGDEGSCVLDIMNQPLRVSIFTEAEEKMTFSRVGRVLHGIEIPRDLFPLYKLGEDKLGIEPNGDPRISSGRLEVNDGRTHNCIVVSFGEGREYALFCIHRTDNTEIYDLYQSIRDKSREAVSVYKAQV